MSRQWDQSSRSTGSDVLVLGGRFLCPVWAHIRVVGKAGHSATEGRVKLGAAMLVQGAGWVPLTCLCCGRPVILLTKGLCQAEHSDAEEAGWPIAWSAH